MLLVLDAGDGDSCDRDVPAGRGVRHWRPEITGVGAMSCQAHDHLVLIRDHVLNREMKVREGIQDPGDPLFIFFTGANLGQARIMEAEVRGIELIKEMSKRLPGYAVPKYAREVAGQPSKTLIL